MSDAFYTAWSALTAVAAVILLALGLAYLVHSISFDTLLLNQVCRLVSLSPDIKLINATDRAGDL